MHITNIHIRQHTIHTHTHAEEHLYIYVNIQQSDALRVNTEKRKHLITFKRPKLGEHQINRCVRGWNFLAFRAVKLYERTVATSQMLSRQCLSKVTEKPYLEKKNHLYKICIYWNLDPVWNPKQFTESSEWLISKSNVVRYAKYQPNLMVL